MKLFEYLDRISTTHKLIIHGNTGTPEEFADHLGVSRTSLYELIDELRLRGAPISYSKSAKTFYYREPFEISITCKFRPMTIEEKKQYSGGNFISKILFFRTMSDEISKELMPC